MQQYTWDKKAMQIYGTIELYKYMGLNLWDNIYVGLWSYLGTADYATIYMGQ